MSPAVTLFLRSIWQECAKIASEAAINGDFRQKARDCMIGIKTALERLGVGVEDCLMVGDSLNRDIEAGNRLGMMTIYAAYGDRRFNGGNGADFVLREFEGLLDLLKVENEIKIKA
ncbi:MAG: HAD hydrolase-like protein [Archaeoglobaceae archaeon]